MQPVRTSPQLLAASLVLLLLKATLSQAANASPGTLGFVVANFNNAIYETQFMDECPEGPAIGNDEFWWRGLSRADKDQA